ncbi:MAG: substrate-binding domain-containing protein [Fimbriimonadales bacterium]
MHRVALTLVALAVLAGCQRPESAPTPNQAAAPGQKLKIVFIPKNQGNPYFGDTDKGFQDAAKELGCEYAMVGPATAEATSQIPIIKDQIQRGVDVIAISANSPDATNMALDEARKKGILIIAVDSDLDKNESHRDAAVLCTDFKNIADSQIELLGSQIGYQGDIAILSATRDAPNQNAWIAKMQETLKQPKYTKMKLVEVVYGDDEPAKSTTETEGLLTKYPNLRGIIAPTTVGVAAAAQQIDIAGVYPGGPHAKGPGVVLTGLGMPNQMRGFITKGVVKSFQLWSPHDSGYIACYLAQEAKQGKVKLAEGGKFTAGKLGERVQEKNSVVIAGPLVTFDKGNIDKYDF